MTNIVTYTPKIFTVLKFQKFTAAQIFREINFRKFRGPKTAILTHLEALNFDFLCIFALLEGLNLPNYPIQSPLKWQKKAVLELLDSEK